MSVTRLIMSSPVGEWGGVDRVRRRVVRRPGVDGGGDSGIDSNPTTDPTANPTTDPTSPADTSQPHPGDTAGSDGANIGSVGGDAIVNGRRHRGTR
jgi:hypothetical protein